jgi:Fungal protein kinase
MTAYDLGLDTTVRPEGCLGSSHYPSYLVKVSDDAWYRTEGVPLWQSTSLLGRGTLVFNAQEHSEPNAPLRILKNAWREDGRLKESELYELMQRSEGPFTSPRALATFVVGGDVPLQDGQVVTIERHRICFGSTVTQNGATVHQLALASRGTSLASDTSFEQLLAAARGIVVGMKFILVYEPYGRISDVPLST